MDDNLVMHWLTRADLAGKTVSYSQNAEDILLARVLNQSEGFYLDVGANHPVFHSVTKLFSDRGWTGINVEPSPPVFERLALGRPRDINLNVGVGNTVDSLTFYETPKLHGWSTFRPELAAHYRQLQVEVLERSVPVTTLTQICRDHVGDRTIDFLKIDAEGFEQHVLQGADLQTWRPRVLVIENAWPEVWEWMIFEARYLFAAFDGLNRFYVRKEDESLLESLRTPVNVLDNFVSHEYLRLLENTISEMSSVRPVKTGLLDTIRVDAPRVARKVRSLARRLGFREAI